MQNAFKGKLGIIVKGFASIAFLMLLSAKTFAQQPGQCLTTYSGRADCDAMIFFQGQNYFASEKRTWFKASVPRPASTLWYLGYEWMCVARQELPATTICRPADVSGQTNVFRFYTQIGTSYADHWSTTDWNEGMANGTYEHVFFRVLNSAIDANTTALYRCRNGTTSDHFASVDPGCEGAILEGTYGYISTIPRTGYTPLYRFWRSGNGWYDHIDTTSWDEVVNWGTYWGTLGYVPQ